MVLVGIGYWCGSMARSVTLVYVMIFFVCAGRSLFQVSAMLGRIVVDKDRMDAAYSIRYTLMNVGGFLGTFSLGILYKDVFAVNGVFGFSACFRVAACAMFLGTIWFISGWRKIGEVGKRPFKTEKTKNFRLRQSKRNGLAQSFLCPDFLLFSGCCGISHICRHTITGQNIWTGR